MSYTEPLFLFIFLPIVMLLFNAIPQKHRWKVLLSASYLFFIFISGKLVVYLLLSTFSIHHIGLWITTIQNECERDIVDVDRQERKEIKLSYKKKQRRVLMYAIILHIGLLIALKYTAFFSFNIQNLFKMLHVDITMPIVKVLVPIGLSFYTLQAISYMVDVYRGTIKADKNLGRLALFMSFFPQIMEGPICRYEQTANKIFEGNTITFTRMSFGFQRIIWGLFKKMVIADRLNPLVATAFNNFSEYNGTVVFMGMICYTIQLYMEFSGTMDIVIGIGEIFGVKMPENFRQPFFSKNVSEFWSRWHITLGTFFKDYIFYPLSLSKPLKKLTSKGRKRLGNHFGPLLSGSCALFVVWICNGFWHGSAWNYIFFGLYYFVLIVLANATEPISKKVLTFLHINRNSKIYTVWQVFRTICLVCVGELVFRANGLQAGFSMLKKMFTSFSFVSFKDGLLLKLGIDKFDFIIVALSLIVVIIVSICHEKKTSLREEISKKNIVIRWIIYYIAIISVVIFGAYGSGYLPVPLIYAGF